MSKMYLPTAVFAGLVGAVELPLMHFTSPPFGPILQCSWLALCLPLTDLMLGNLRKAPSVKHFLLIGLLGALTGEVINLFGSSRWVYGPCLLIIFSSNYLSYWPAVSRR